MASRAGSVLVEGLTQVDTAKRFALGHRVSIGGSEYVYVQGVTSGAAGAWATFTSAGVTTLLTANASGLVCILLADLDATTKYGFALVKGSHSAAKVDAAASAGLPVYIDGTAGRVDAGTDVSGDLVINAITTGAASSNLVAVFINHPMVINVAID
jgi:uncharacterized protein (DUF2126 family)